MSLRHLRIERPVGVTQFYDDLVELRTEEHLQFIDLTELVTERVRRSGIVRGLVNVQTRHTTTAILVNENEPRLLEDLTNLLARLAPREADYRHNDLDARVRFIEPEERPNGHSHMRAAVLGPAVCLNVLDGKLQLGRWQSLFLVELDGARKRSVSIHVIGLTR